MNRNCRQMDRPELPSALEHFEDIVEQGSGRDLTFFVDYDGTLVGLTMRPELAVMPEDARALLASLAERHLVCVLSGRGLDDLRGLVGLDSVYYAANHGHEVEGPWGSPIHLRLGCEFRAALSAAAQELQQQLARIEGLIIESKGFSVAVHYRLVRPSQRGTVEAAVKKVAGHYDEIRLRPGKLVYEFRPATEWDKGKALLWLLERLDLAPGEVFPICLGDDLTDEDAFAAVDGWGATIVVGEARAVTRANYWLPGPREVADFLALFVQPVACKSPPGG